MSAQEFFDILKDIKTNAKKNKELEEVYGIKLPKLIQKLVAYAENTVFLDNDLRVLSYSEIIDAESDLHVDFRKLGMIPLLDCGDNDFIVYHFKTGIWSKFNIVDETVFMKKDRIQDFFKD